MCRRALRTHADPVLSAALLGTRRLSVTISSECQRMKTEALFPPRQIVGAPAVHVMT